MTRFHGVTLSEGGYESTARLLTDTFGCALLTERDHRVLYSSAADVVELLCRPDARRGGMGSGTVHPMAFRNVTPVLDRRYFHSICFRLSTSLRLPPQYESAREELERALPVPKLPKYAR